MTMEIKKNADAAVITVTGRLDTTTAPQLEKAITQLDEEMAEVACDAVKLAEVYEKKQETEALLEQEMLRWEELSLLLEENEV